MIGRRLFLAIVAAAAVAGAAEAQRFDPRGNFDDSSSRARAEWGDRSEERLSHEQLRAIVARQFDVLEMRTSGECGDEFWALIITREGRHQWVVLDVRDGGYVRTQGYAPSCG